jgi:hypothetical protein
MRSKVKPEQRQLSQIFYPLAWEKIGRIVDGTPQRFVHYTSAEAAMSILKNKEVWLRKASMMNDFGEITYGIKTLVFAYEKESKPLKELIDHLFPGLSGEVEALFNSWEQSFREDTFITCMSEHENSEDGLGRLSMWRAYGGTASVALVFNPNVFVSNSGILGATTSPVAYLTKEKMGKQIIAFTQNIERNGDVLSSLSRDDIRGHLFNVLRLAAICTKHPGFKEEREWRVVYNPKLQASDRVKREIVSIGGIPQPICKIPLKDDLDSGLIGAEIPKLIDRIIIGPSKHPLELRDTFVELLGAARMLDANQRVWVSDIPLRT